MNDKETKGPARPPGNPLLTEADALLDEVRQATTQHGDNVAELRASVAIFNDKVANKQLSANDAAALDGTMTEIEGALNKLDPDSPITN